MSLSVALPADDGRLALRVGHHVVSWPSIYVRESWHIGLHLVLANAFSLSLPFFNRALLSQNARTDTRHS